jgi:hypothetical protein
MSQSQAAFADAGAGANGHAPDDDGVDVHIDDTRPAPEREERQTRREQPAADRAGDEFGRRANRRISSLLGRAKSAEERAAALERENAELRHGTLRQGQARLTAEEERTRALLAAAQRDIRIARDAGDTETEMKAQTRLADLSAQAREIARDKQRVDFEASRVPAAPPAAPSLSPAMSAWKDANEWFQSDPAMTNAALAFHGDALGRGFKPESPEYFAHIDKQVRRSFPDYFGDDDAHASQAREQDDGRDVELDTAAAAPRAPIVAAAPRRNQPGAQGQPAKRVIHLSAEQRAIAKSLNISDQQYAASLAKRANSGARA